MGLIGKIMVRLGLDNSEYSSRLKHSEAQGNKFTSAIKKMGAAMLAAFSVQMITRFAKESIKAYNQQVAAIAKLESVLKSTGGAAGLTSKELQEYASELQKATTFGDEITLEAMARLASFKSISGDIFKGTIAAAQDLATVLGTDLNSSIMQVGKALEMPELGMTMLRRSGVSFSQEQIDAVRKLLAENKKQEAQLIILTELQSQFGGAAKAAADTAGGAWKQAGNSFGDFIELIGSGTEKTNGFARSLKDWFDTLNQAATSETLSWFEKLTVFLGGNQKALRKLTQEQKDNEAYWKRIKDSAEAIVAPLETEEQLLRMINSIRKEGMSDRDKEVKQLAEAKLLQLQGAKVEEGLIPVLKEKIKEREELRDLETDPLRLRILNDEIAAMNERLKVMQMTTKEYQKYMEAQRRTPLGPTLPQGGTITQPQVVSGQDPFKGGAYGYLTAHGENIANQMKAQNDKLEQEKARAEQIAQGFQNAFVNILGNSIEQLTSIIAGTEKLNTGQVVATLLTPLADMAITAGGIIMTTGTAIESLKASLVAFFGGSAIAAGAALIAVGAAAKIGLKALATGGSKSAGSAGSSTTSFTGGLAPIQFKPMESVELYSRIKGSDIYLASKKYEQNRSR